MSTLWIGREHMLIRKYSVAGTGAKAVVKIEVEVTDPNELGFFLRELEEAKRSIDDDRKARADAQRAERKPQKTKAIGRASVLALPFYGDRE